MNNGASPTALTPTLPPIVEETVDDEGLQLTQYQLLFISNYRLSKTIKEACEKTGCKIDTYYRWKKIPDFAEALQRITVGVIDSARHRMDGMMEKAADVMEKALDTKTITDCPSCHKSLVCAECNVTVTIDNWKNVLKVTEMLLKRKGEFVSRHETKVSGTITHERDLPHELAVGAALVRIGEAVPPEIEARLRAVKAWPEVISSDDSEDDDVVEGTVRTLDSEEPSSSDIEESPSNDTYPPGPDNSTRDSAEPSS